MKACSRIFQSLLYIMWFWSQEANQRTLPFTCIAFYGEHKIRFEEEPPWNSSWRVFLLSLLSCYFTAIEDHVFCDQEPFFLRSHTFLFLSVFSCIRYLRTHYKFHHKWSHTKFSTKCDIYDDKVRKRNLRCWAYDSTSQFWFQRFDVNKLCATQSKKRHG